MAVNLIDDRSFGSYHLADNPSQYQPATSNTFRFIVYGINNMRRAGTRDEYVKNGQEIVDFSANSVFIPNFTQQVITINRGNSQVKFAGTPQWSNGSLRVYDYIDADGKSVLQAWQAQQYDVLRDVVYRVATTGYKKKAHLIEYTSDNRMVRYWELQGCWISGISEDAMDSTNGSSARQITATIEFDRAIPHMPDEELVALA